MQEMFEGWMVGQVRMLKPLAHHCGRGVRVPFDQRRRDGGGDLASRRWLTAVATVREVGVEGLAACLGRGLVVALRSLQFAQDAEGLPVLGTPSSGDTILNS
jgi:hypothetical protein